MTLPGGSQDATSSRGRNLDDLFKPVGVEREHPDETRAKIARWLTVSVISIAVAIAVCCIAVLLKIAFGQDISEADKRITLVQSLITAVLSQTLYPLTTIAIGWYFAEKLSSNRSGG